MGKKAFTHVLWNFGPEQRLHLTCNLLKYIDKSLYRNIRQFSLFNQSQKFRGENVSLYPSSHFDYPVFPEYQVIVAYNSVNLSKVGVIIPMFNYESYVLDALESVKNQTLKNIDLVVMDDCSTDRSLKNAVDWINANHERFNRCAVIRNPENCGLALTRNAGFDYLQTPWVMQLDADNELLPECLETSLEKIENSGAAMAFGQLELFGENQELINQHYTHPTIGNKPWNPADFVPGNYIDAMALLSKAHWAKAGGYFTNFRVHGWEDYDLWLRFVEHGFYGIYIPKIIARYRIHNNSMLRKTSEMSKNKRHQEIKLRHPWVD
jgi:glycosyltransferase involved in cell wall biosynthesis